VSQVARIKVCLNGARSRQEHPAVPVTAGQLVHRAGQLGLATRIGLEDTITGPVGEPVSGNAELTQKALAIWTAAA
jgi:uncharacterized protein (DUF849 family)